MSQTTFIDEDGTSLIEEPKKKTRKRKPEAPKIQFPLPPKFTGPLKVFIADGPEDPIERDEWMYKTWLRSGPPSYRTFKDSGWTTDDLVGSQWIMYRFGIMTITGLQASQWGEPELADCLPEWTVIHPDTKPFCSHINGTITDDEGHIHWMLNDAIFILHSVRFDTMPAALQHRWLQVWTEYRENELVRQKQEHPTDKYGKLYAQHRADYARKTLHEFEQQHQLRPTYAVLQRQQPPQRRKRAVVSPLQASLFG